MANNIPDMVKITLDTSSIQDLDASTQAPLGTYKGVLKDLDSDLKAFEKVLQSATNNFDFFNNNLKKIDTNTGLAQQSFYIRREELDNAMSALKAKSASLAPRRGGDYNFTVEDVEMITSKRTIYGKQAQEKAKEEVDRLGGTLTVDPKNPDKVTISIPYDSKSLSGMTKGQKASLITQAIPEARKLSNIEHKARKEEEVYRKAEEDKKAEDEKIKSSSKKTAFIFKAMLATLTIISDIVRRILTASLKQASENTKMATEAHDIGVTGLERRGYDIFDIAHGMEKGSTFGAMQSIQGMFGDVTSLDEKALGTLARVMGSEVGEAVRSGMGGQNPDQLLEKIMDKYFKQYLSGRNSLGQQVGMEQARRELVTSLQSISPEIARLFSQMADDYSSGYYGKFDSWQGWRGTTSGRSGMTEATRNFSNEIGKKYNDIIAIVEDLKTSFFTKLGNSLDGLLNRVKNIRLGQSGSDVITEDIKNREANKRNREILQGQLTLYKSNTQSAVDAYTKGDKFKYNTELLAGIMTGVYDEKYFRENSISGTGMLSPKDIKAYIARGKSLADSLMFNPEVQDELTRSAVILKRIQEIDTENKKEAGAGIANLAMTAVAQDAYAQAFIEKNTTIAGRGGTLSTMGADIQSAVVTAYYHYLIDNPNLLNKQGMSKNSRTRYQKAIEAIMKRDKVKRYEDMTLAQKAEAMASANAEEWYAQNFALWQSGELANKAEFNYLKAYSRDKAVGNLNISDSKILNRLTYESLGLTGNSQYSITGSQGRSGEYVLKIQMLDSSGRATGQPIVKSLSDTSADSMSGKITTDSKGNIMYYNAN